MNGFTLVELLIAMTLTAVIGMVLFSTYSMVMDNGKTVRNRVLERESERVFWGILDNDIAGLCLIDDKRSTLPPLSREPIVPSDAFYRLTETDKPQPSDDEVLLSFATSSHLADMPAPPCPARYAWNTSCATATVPPPSSGASGPTAAWKATSRGPSWCLSAM